MKQKEEHPCLSLGSFNERNRTETFVIMEREMTGTGSSE